MGAFRADVVKLLKRLFLSESMTNEGRELRDEYLWRGRNRFLGPLHPSLTLVSLHLDPSYAAEASRRIAQGRRDSARWCSNEGKHDERNRKRKRKPATIEAHTNPFGPIL